MHYFLSDAPFSSLPDQPKEPPESESIFCGICNKEITEDESFSRYEDCDIHEKCEKDQ